MGRIHVLSHGLGADGPLSGSLDLLGGSAARVAALASYCRADARLVEVLGAEEAGEGAEHGLLWSVLWSVMWKMLMPCRLHGQGKGQCVLLRLVASIWLKTLRHTSKAKHKTRCSMGVSGLVRSRRY